MIKAYFLRIEVLTVVQDASRYNCGNSSQKIIDIGHNVRYNMINLIRKQCYHCCGCAVMVVMSMKNACTGWLSP